MRLKKLLVRAGALGARPTDRLVLLALLGFADHRTHECFPTQDSLAELTGQARSTVIASTRRLEAAGLLSRTQDPVTRAYTYRLVDTRTDENPNRVLAEQTRARIDEDPTRAGYTAARPKRTRGVRVLPGQLALHLPAPELTWGAPEFVSVPVHAHTPRVVAAAHHQGGRRALPQGSNARTHTESPLTPPARRGDGEGGSSFFERSAPSATEPRLERSLTTTTRDLPGELLGSSKSARVVARLPFTPQQLGEVFAKHAPERSVLTGPLERRLERRLGYVILDLVRAGFALDDVARAAQYYEKNDTPFLRGVLGWSSLGTAGRLRDLVAFTRKERTKELARAHAKPVVSPRPIETPRSAEERARVLQMARQWRTQGPASEPYAAPHGVEPERAARARTVR